MGTELVMSRLKEEELDFPAIPPGFGPLASFSLKKVEDSAEVICFSGPANASGSQSTKMEIESDINDNEKPTRALRRRSSINYNQLERGDYIYENFDKNITVRPCLPKGVIRGCTECSNCQKVTARWRSEDACRPALDDAPVFYPSEEEFEDTISYIASIRPIAEPYGICRIVPPPSWKPPCPLKEKSVWESSKFSTRIQRVDKLQNRNSMRSSSQSHNQMRRKRRRGIGAGTECKPGSSDFLGCGAAIIEAETFGFELGPQFTLNSFQKYADDFMTQYFRKNGSDTNLISNTTPLEQQFEPSVENIEGEYWRVVQKPTEEIEVLYGADLETGNFGSGFPKMSSQDSSVSLEQYIQSGWNLNNFPRLTGSVLSYESGDISGVLVPWLYIGMCFSSFCWHVEDHHLYSMNYLHWGAPKLWYGVPGKEASKLEAAMRKHLPDLFKEQPDLLNKLVTQLSPAILKSEGVPVYRCIQNSGEFVLTFPRAYHSGFNCGFNCAEAVNVAPVDWLLHGQNAIELYRRQRRKTSISHDKLLLGAAREAVRAHWELNLLKKNTSNNLRWKGVCGKEGILTKAFKKRVQVERSSRELLCNSSQVLKMENDFDATTERECSICFYDLHLSAAGCHCSPDRFACLNHAKQLCSCPLTAKFLLLRYEINDLNILVEALEGKLSAIYRWARLDLGLALSSYGTNDNMQVPEQVPELHHCPNGVFQKEITPYVSKTSFSELKVKYKPKDITTDLTGILGETFFPHRETPAEVVLALEATVPLPPPHKLTNVIKIANKRRQSKKNGSTLSASDSRMPVCQLSQEDMSYTASSVTAEVKKPSFADHASVILLSDDEGREPEKPAPSRPKQSLASHADLSERLTGSDNKMSLCNYNTKDVILTAPATNATVMGETNSLLPDGERNSHPFRQQMGRTEDQGSGGAFLGIGSYPQDLSFVVESTTTGFDKSVQNSSMKLESGDVQLGNCNHQFQHPRPSCYGRTNEKNKHGNKSLKIHLKSMDNGRTITGKVASNQTNLDKYFCQKGPRMAKVVRRISCNVEPLEIGSVISGKLWCNSQAIFPKGYRSRVRYISVLDPADMSYYISEILDGGRVGPLFMVSLENFPSEVFVHVTAARCWEMVRERVNQEISKQHKLGRMKLPPLQPPGSLDGIEMFGFSSPAIVQAIEAMDRNRVCTEYWNMRPYSRFQVQFSENSQSVDKGSYHHTTSARSSNTEPPEVQQSVVGTDMVLHGLFKKANPEELHSLCSILSKNNPSTDRGLLNRLLNEEIQKRL